MDELVLHEATRQLLHKNSKKLPHSLLIVGKPGSGVGTIARTLAKSVGTVLEIVLPKKRQTSGTYAVDTENGSIIIDDVRSLYDRTRSKFTSPQIVIIDFSGRPMSHGAQNAFLKLLEEPQDQVCFILASNDSSNLLPTILSRCQRIDIMPITREQSENLLASLAVDDATKRARILFIAAGLPAEILRLSRDDSYYEARVKTVQDARTILEGDGYARLKLVQAYKDKRVLALQLLDDSIHQLQLSLGNAVQPTTFRQIDALIDAHEKITANGNIQLNLAKVLL